jgi:hypothetical protein
LRPFKKGTANALTRRSYYFVHLTVELHPQRAIAIEFDFIQPAGGPPEAVQIACSILGAALERELLPSLGGD